MALINSVLGPLDTKDLGFTLCHEHVMVGPPGFFRDYPELFGKNVVERLVSKLKKSKQAGIDTIVDCTTVDLGRDVNLLVEVSRRSGVNIIACTGWWLNTPAFFTDISPDRIADWFVRDIQQGIGGTSVKAGVLKGASDMGGVTAEGNIVLRALARAHRQTDVPIVLHSFPRGQVGKEQLAILTEEGVNPRRIKFDHSNDTTDVGYLVWLMQQGCYLGLDRYPGEGVPPRQRTVTMKALIDAGYAGKLCPSHDHLMSYLQPEATEDAEEGMQTNPYGLLYMKEVVFKHLREIGTSGEILGRLCVEGPRNFFEGK
ncbi:MAG: hypothetical protein PHR43_03145 [Dehalococcoidales bacterium]|nr:hypothetical protein [Dehalococcoidales bacterium]